MSNGAHLYWRNRKSGQHLIFHTEDDQELEVGAVRSTPRGYDALAKTTGYDPGRAQRGFGSMEDAKAFVESVRPWEIYHQDGQPLEVDPTVRPAPE